MAGTAAAACGYQALRSNPCSNIAQSRPFFSNIASKPGAASVWRSTAKASSLLLKTEHLRSDSVAGKSFRNMQLLLSRLAHSHWVYAVVVG